jgi:hypothetical protein
MTAPDGFPAEGTEDVGLVIPVPNPDTVVFVIRDGDKYAYMPIAREYLESPEWVYDAVRKTLTHMDRYIAELEQHGKARNAGGQESPGT